MLLLSLLVPGRLLHTAAQRQLSFERAFGKPHASFRHEAFCCGCSQLSCRKHWLGEPLSWRWIDK